jgi:hypothetical protein
MFQLLDKYDKFENIYICNQLSIYEMDFQNTRYLTSQQYLIKIHVGLIMLLIP